MTDDTISREEAIRLYCREHCGWEPEKCPLKFERDGTEECSFVRLLKELPSVQPEQKKGKWIKDCNVAFYWKCSECGSYLIGTKEDYLLRENDYPNYCPNCGARMEE